MPELLDNVDLQDSSKTKGVCFWDDRPGEWYVLHVRPRQEKALVDHLSSESLALYVPLWPQIRFYGKRKKKVDLPLFPGYAFLKGDRDAVILADRTKRLVGIIDVQGQDELAWELEGVNALLKCGEPFASHPGLSVGERVSVRSGPMKGIQGVVESIGKTERLVIQVETLGRAVSVEVDMSLVDPIDNE